MIKLVLVNNLQSTLSSNIKNNNEAYSVSLSVIAQMRVVI